MSGSPPGIERAHAMKWLCWVGASVTPVAMMYVLNTSERTPVEHRDANAAERAKTELMPMLAILDRALEGRDYLLDSGFSLADLGSVSFVAFFSRIGIDTSSFENVTAWIARCTSRPALERAWV